MNADLVNPFIVSTCDVFRTMLSCNLTRGPIALKDGSEPKYEVSGLIGLSGKYQGMVVVSLSRETALAATGILAGTKPTELNADVVDAIGELANMIAGAAKGRLEKHELSISLPSVICGTQHCIRFPSSSKPLVLPFNSDIGPISVELGLAAAV